MPSMPHAASKTTSSTSGVNLSDPNVIFTFEDILGLNPDVWIAEYNNNNWQLIAQLTACYAM